MRVSFRWSRGALATKLRRSPAGYVVRVPAGTKAGTISRARHRPRRAPLARDPPRRRCRRRSSARRRPPAARCPPSFRGNGMWIWELPKSERRRPRRDRRPGARRRASSTVFVKSSDGADDRGRSSTRRSSQALHAHGLHVCAWQFVYGNDPLGEAAQGASAVATGADCLVIDAETPLRGQVRAGAAVRRRAAGGGRPRLPDRPDVVPVRRLPPAAAVLGLPRPGRRPGQPAAGLLEGHRRDRRRGQRAHARPQPHLRRRRSRRSARPTSRRRRPRSSASAQVWAAYGAGGLSWWSWQATGAVDVGRARRRAARRRRAAARPGLAGARQGLTRATRSSGCRSTSRPSRPTLPVDGDVRHGDRRGAARLPDVARPARRRGETDAATWQAVLALPVQPGRLGGARRRRVAEPARRRVAAAYRRA